MLTNLEYVASVVGTNFTEALASDAIEIESLSLPDSWSKVELHEGIIESVTVQSKQNLEWDVFIFSSALGPTSDLDNDTFIDLFNFPKTEAIQIGGAGQYYCSSPSNHIAVPYKDQDLTSKLHIGLVNRGRIAKYAGVNGEVKIRIVMRGIYGV